MHDEYTTVSQNDLVVASTEASLSAEVSSEISSLSAEVSSLSAEVSLSAEIAFLASAFSLVGNAVTFTVDVDSGCLSLHLVVLSVVPDGLSLVQRLESILVDGREMDEDILGTISRSDETEPLLGVEELDRSLARHFCGVCSEKSLTNL